jgi:hypothetical protein
VKQNKLWSSCICLRCETRQIVVELHLFASCETKQIVVVLHRLVKQKNKKTFNI